jgi:hypothetical protein
MLKDGSSFSGVVKKSSASEITIQAPTGESRTIPTTEVSSVQYGATPPTATTTPSATQSPSANASPAPTIPPPAAPPASTESAAPAAGSAAPAATAEAPLAAPMAATDAGPAAPPAAPKPVEVVRTISAGTSLSVRNNETIDSKTAAVGQTFSGVIAQDVRDRDGRVAIPRGSPATLVVRSVEAQGKIQGQSELALDIESVRVAGHRYRLETAEVAEKGKQGVGANKRTGKFVGGGAALGTLLGAIAGGGKGAAIGALSGAAAGTATQAVTRGKGVHVPPETLMTFRLEAPIRIKEVR